MAEELITLVSGGFDPAHSGHIALLKSAKALGGLLVVGLNSDEWLIRKKGYRLLPWYERKIVLSNFKQVDGVIGFNDDDNTAIDAIKSVVAMFPGYRYIFVNGGDRTSANIPEMGLAATIPNLEFAFGVGGTDKKNSSSWLVNDLMKQTQQVSPGA